MTRDTPQIATIESIFRADGTFVHVHLANGACFQSIVPNNDYRFIVPIAHSLVAFALSSDVRMTQHRHRQAQGDYRAYRGRMVRADEVPLDDR